MNKDQAETLWLILLFQFPKGPDSRRVKVWRRLQSIGAVAIKNSVYVLPLNEQSREDFQWLLTELGDSGAEVAILESRFVDGMSDQQVRELFKAARSADYQGLYEEIETAVATLTPDRDAGDSASLDKARRALGHARKRLADIEAIDFFAAPGHDRVEAAMRTLIEQTSDKSKDITTGERTMTTAELPDLTGRVWVTRRGVKVDRIASAWLIRRWIDGGARFKFVSGQDYAPTPKELRFDMFEAEFTHEGELCTFEVLARLVRKDDAALRKVGEIVHDIDLKDAKFERPETTGVANLLTGIVSGTNDDERRIARGSEMFDDLYRFFANSES